MTICYKCNLGLGGWEEEDSPMCVHVNGPTDRHDIPLIGLGKVFFPL